MPIQTQLSLSNLLSSSQTWSNAPPPNSYNKQFKESTESIKEYKLIKRSMRSKDASKNHLGVWKKCINAKTGKW